MEQLKDVYSHFMLYYRNDIQAMWEAKRKKKQSEDDAADGESKTTPPKQKMPAKRDLYTICKQAGNCQIQMTCSFVSIIEMKSVFLLHVFYQSSRCQWFGQKVWFDTRSVWRELA